MPNLLPFRSYSEHDVVNLYSCNTVATKGTLVRLITPIDKNVLNLSNTSVGNKFPNTINNNFDIIGRVEIVSAYNTVPAAVLGLLLCDVRETDENGERLIFNPRKMAEMGVVMPIIHAVPILTRGIVSINDIDETSREGGGGGVPRLGAAAYVGNDGRIGVNGIIKIGKFLSTKDSNGYCLVKVNFD
jgi:hypothetical protein